MLSLVCLVLLVSATSADGAAGALLPDVSLLLRQSLSDDVSKAFRATVELVERGEGDLALPGLVKLARSPRDAIVIAAALWFNNVGPAAEHASAELQRLTSSWDHAVRFLACNAVCSLGPQAVCLLPDLMDRLRSPSEQYTCEVLRMVGSIGPAAQIAAPLVRNYLTAESARTRSEAADALGSLGLIDEPIANALTTGLDDADRHVRGACARALGRLGARTEGVLGALRAHTLDSDLSVREAAGCALVALGDRLTGLVTLRRCVREDPDPPASMLESLANAGSVALAVRYLSNAVNKGIRCRSSAAIDALRVLARLGPLAAAAEPVVERALRTWEDPWDCVEAALALARVGQVRQALPLLIGSLTRGAGGRQHYPYRPRLDQFAAEALGKIGPAASPALPALRELLDDRHEDVRSAAAMAIARITESTGRGGAARE